MMRERERQQYRADRLIACVLTICIIGLIFSITPRAIIVFGL